MDYGGDGRHGSRVHSPMGSHRDVARLQVALRLYKAFVCNSGRQELPCHTSEQNPVWENGWWQQQQQWLRTALQLYKGCFLSVLPPTPVCSSQGEAAQQGPPQLPVLPKSGLPHCRHLLQQLVMSKNKTKRDPEEKTLVPSLRTVRAQPTRPPQGPTQNQGDTCMCSPQDTSSPPTLGSSS